MEELETGNLNIKGAITLFHLSKDAQSRKQIIASLALDQKTCNQIAMDVYGCPVVVFLVLFVAVFVYFVRFMGVGWW
ncbi:MAG: hypothetical protein NWF05_01610 [Candidatus Bathyarchaeota archaeon]|nr:hypothetical protein [Candidatus Bathyarchaeota archaeon]